MADINQSEVFGAKMVAIGKSVPDTWLWSFFQQTAVFSMPKEQMDTLNAKASRKLWKFLAICVRH